MKKILIGIIVILLGILGYMFMGSSNTSNEHENKVVVEHSLGVTEVPKNPKRVIVFDYGILDMLDTLGANVIGLPKDLVPAHLNKYEADEYVNVGSLKEPNVEKIYELKPDLIIIAGRQRSFYDQLTKVAPTVFVETSSTDYMGGLEKNVEILTTIFDNSQVLKDGLNEIKGRVENVRNTISSKNLKAMILLSNSGRLSTYGEKSRFSIIYDYLGFSSTGELPTGTHGNKVTFEYLLEKNPDYIFIIDKAAVTGSDILANKAFDNPIVNSTKAAQNGNIVFLDSVVWYTASGGIASTNLMLNEIEKATK